MTIEVQITDAVLGLKPRTVPGCGAIARFEGIVRDAENGEPITGLEYEAYQPMAENIIREILGQLQVEHPFELARVQHRTGTVRVGEAAVIVEIHSPHRAEAFATLAKFMDRLKQDVPIWKVRAIKGKGARTSRPRTHHDADGTSANQPRRGRNVRAPL